MNNPKPEHRITAVEKRVTHIEGAIEELASDQAEDLRAIRQDIKSGFNEIGTLFDRNFESIEALQRDVATIKATMATKDDIVELKGLIMQVLGKQEK